MPSFWQIGIYNKRIKVVGNDGDFWVVHLPHSLPPLPTVPTPSDLIYTMPILKACPHLLAEVVPVF